LAKKEIDSHQNDRIQGGSNNHNGSANEKKNGKEKWEHEADDLKKQMVALEARMDKLYVANGYTKIGEMKLPTFSKNEAHPNDFYC
jgi:hypothetical protein